MSERFHGKSVLVTGAGSGIGRATARLFASEGAHVIAMDIGEGVDETASSHDTMISFRGDASSDADVMGAISLAAQHHGCLDIMCANAGISGGEGGLFDQSVEDWEAVLRVNLIGPFLAIKHASQAMLAARKTGSIICTASVAGLRSGAGGPAYSASKAGVINLVQTAAQQLSGSGIRVNAVCPGLTETGMTKIIYDSARARSREKNIGQLNPLKRGGEPIEIARAIAFLASDEASYVNGHALVVDGGLSSSHPFARPRALGETTF